MRSSVDGRASTWSYCEIESSASTAERSRQSCDMSLCYFIAKIKFLLIGKWKKLERAHQEYSKIWGKYVKQGWWRCEWRFMSCAHMCMCVLGLGGRVKFEPCVYPKCHYLQMIQLHVSCQCVSVQRTHNLFRLRSIVTAHINVLPNNSHCGPNLTHEFHNVKLKAFAHSLFYPRCAHRWMVELRREAIVKLNRQHPLLKDQGNLVIWACVIS